MKNVMFIDGADNCAYDVFQFSDDEFADVFPDDGQDIEFAEEASDRLSGGRFSEIMKKVATRPVSRKDAAGIQGILFFQLQKKKKYYPTKRDADMANPA